VPLLLNPEDGFMKAETCSCCVLLIKYIVLGYKLIYFISRRNVIFLYAEDVGCSEVMLVQGLSDADGLVLTAHGRCGRRLSDKGIIDWPGLERALSFKGT
jgi:hypothetical protein